MSNTDFGGGWKRNPGKVTVYTTAGEPGQWKGVGTWN